MMKKRFWVAALIRAIRTIAQTAIATIGTAALLSEVNWLAVGSASALAGILSVLTSISTGLPEAVEADGAWLDASRTGRRGMADRRRDGGGSGLSCDGAQPGTTSGGR